MRTKLFLALLGIAASIMTALAQNSSSSSYFVYIGTYGKGVYAFRYDPSGPKLIPLNLVGSIENPSWVTAGRDHRHLFAVSELNGNVEGAIAGFGINRKTGILTEINSRPSGGQAPCHAAVDATGKVLIVANYVTGGVSSYPIAQDGRIGEMASLMTTHGSGPNKSRQEGPHAHEVVISADNKRVYVPDLGLDRIRIYRLDVATAKLTPNDPPYVQEAGGYGPRHMVFGHHDEFAYVLNEINAKLTVFKRDASNGNLELIQTVDTLPREFTGENTAAEIRLNPSGTFLYTSNRGHDTIEVFAVDAANGTVRMIQSFPSQGKTPRGFALDPAGHHILIGNQESNNLVVLDIDSNTGHLSASGQSLNVPSPVDVLFVPAE